MLQSRGFLSSSSLLLLLSSSSDDDDDDLVFSSLGLVFCELIVSFFVVVVDLSVARAQRSQHSPAVKLTGIRCVTHLYIGHALVLHFGLAIRDQSN
jgi:hypothetical protein